MHQVEEHRRSPGQGRDQEVPGQVGREEGDPRLPGVGEGRWGGGGTETPRVPDQQQFKFIIALCIIHDLQCHYTNRFIKGHYAFK